jgi:transposase
MVDGLFEFSFKEGGFNGEFYFQFLTIIFEKLRSKNVNNATIVADNVPFHKMESVRELVRNNGHNYVFLPPYSPQLNPIEEVFSKWKHLVKARNSRNVIELLETISSCSELISTEDINGCISHMREFLVKSARRETF